MKMIFRITLLSMLVLLVMIPAATGAAAQETDNPVLDLAEYAPAGTSVFAAVRTDAGYFDTLDTLIANVLAKFPPELVGMMEVEPSVELLLNEMFFPAGYDYEAGEMVPSEYTFAEDVRPWLGDSIAFVLPSLDPILFGAPDISLAFVLDITDKDAAVAFFEEAIFAEDIEDGDVEKVEQTDGSVLFNYLLDASSLLVTDEAAFVFTGSDDAVVMPGEDAASLDSTAVFNDVIAALPAEDYNVIAYFDASPLIESVSGMLPMLLGPEAGEMVDAAMIANALGQQALGLTIVENRSLVIDVATSGEMMMEPDPLDLELLERVPADAVLVTEGDDLGSMIQSGLDLLYLANDLLTEFGMLPLEDAGPLAGLGPDDLATFLTLSFEGTYGLDLEETLAWLDGDHTLYVRVPLVEEGSLLGDLTGFSVQQGFVLATDNPDASAEFVAALADQAMSIYATATFEDGVLTIPLGDLLSMSDVGQITVASDETIFAAGDVASVAFALEPGEENLTTTAGYVYESGLFLPGTEMLLYLDIEPVVAAFNAFGELNSEMMMEEDAAIMGILLNLVDTASITASSGDSGAAVRLTLTLGE